MYIAHTVEVRKLTSGRGGIITTTLSNTLAARDQLQVRNTLAGKM